MRFRNAFIDEMFPEFLQPFRYFGIRRVIPFVCVILIFIGFSFFGWVSIRFPRSCSPALPLAIDTGEGVEPLLSCGNDIGVADELEAVDRPGTTLGT